MAKVVLIGWPGADSAPLNALIDAGEMPCLTQIVDQGAIGSLAGNRPVVAPLVWNSIATGTRAYQHRILGLHTVDERSAEVAPISAATRGVPAIWEILAMYGLRCGVVGWWATHGSRLADSCVVSEAFGHPALAATAELTERSIHPASLHNVLAPLWVHPEEMDKDAVSFFFPDDFDLSRVPRPVLTAVAEALAFSASRHAAFTKLISDETLDFAAVCLPLLESFAPALVSYGPVLKHNKEAGELVRYALNAGYKLLDQFLQRTLELCGKDVTVLLVSPYGAKFGARERVPPHLRPNGILIAAGSTIEKDSIIHGANALDIAPTLLQLFDLPVGHKMEGRVLAELFREPRTTTIATSWPEQYPLTGNQESGPDDPVSLDTIGRTLAAHFARLQVVDSMIPMRPDVRRVRERMRWYLALSFLDGRNPSRALPLLEELSHEEPESDLYALRLAGCQLQLNMLQEARASVDLVLAMSPDSTAARMLLARLEQRSGHAEPALRQLQELERMNPGGVFLYDQMGLAYLRLRHWPQAIEQFRKALELEPDDAAAYLGVARGSLGARCYEDAADAALSSIGISYQQPVAHYILGLALARQEKTEQALKAFEVAAVLAPESPRAHYQLLRFKRSLGASEAELAPHRRAVAGMTRGKREIQAQISEQAERREEQRRALTAARRQRDASEWEEAVLAGYPDMPRDSTPMNLTVVSGLPRSGCSLVAQMLAVGGHELHSDKPGDPTVSDWLALRQLPRKPDVLDEARGKAVKILSPLLSALPQVHHYKILFVHRPLAEIVMSQQQVLQQCGRDLDMTFSAAEGARLLARHRSAVLGWLRIAPNIDLLELDYPKLCEEPAVYIDQIVDFIGQDRLPFFQNMSAVVDDSRHRVRLDSDSIPDELRFNLLFAT